MRKNTAESIDHQLVDPAFFGDEDQFYRLFARMRREDPVHWTVSPDGTGVWSVFKHADVKTVLNNNTLFSSEREGDMPIFTRDVEVVAQEAFGIGDSILVTDPPRHTELRRVVDPPFKPKPLVELTERCGLLIKEIFDNLPENGECDVVSDIGAKIPMAVICDVLKIPKDDWDTILQWGKMTLGAGDPEYITEGSTAVETMLKGFRGMREYCGKRALERRGCPYSDPLTLLANAEINGQRLTDSEIAYNGLVLLIAGFETTRNAFAGGVLALLQNPLQMSKLRENPKLVRLAAEEMVRWTNPVISVMRVATADAEIGGKAIREDDRVIAWLASANRDEDAFERADEFDVSRHPNLHVGFGGGAHFCVGGPLAKIEISFALQETLERYDGIEIIGPVERVHANFVGGLKRLPVRLRRKTPAAHTSVRNV
ncbi:MAG: cytochrome P450 [Gammaproteobacteria bacterium]